jgi:hypothetical protein
MPNLRNREPRAQGGIFGISGMSCELSGILALTLADIHRRARYHEAIPCGRTKLDLFYGAVHDDGQDEDGM